VPTIRGRPAFRELAANLKPGVTVSLVSLPLSVSLALASGATPVQGIITACWAGLVSAAFGGSHYNVVGPTGALSGILSYYSVKYGPAIQPLLAVITGFMCVLVWLSGVYKYLVFIPGAVMHGFTMGVAFIISANQINFALGLPKLKRHPLFLENLAESFANAGKSAVSAIAFFAVGLAALLVLSRRYPRVPWAVVLAAIGIVIGSSADAAGSAVPQTIRTQYGDLSLALVQISPVFNNGVPNTDTAEAALTTWFDLLRGALSITAVAVLETLISARIADRLTKTLFDSRQEVLSVGLANLASGATGGLPATAALARTALNIKSGATSRAAGIVNGVSLIILSTVLFDQFKFLPLPVVAAILCNTAYRMLEVDEIVLLARTDPAMFTVAVVTALICIVEDPTMGIVYGTGLAMVRSLMAMLHGHALLQVFKGTRCELQWFFTLNNHEAQLAACRTAYTSEPDARALAQLAAQTKAEREAAVTELAQATQTLQKAREAAKSQVARSVKKAIASVEFEVERGVNPEGHLTAIAEADVDNAVPRCAVYAVAGYFTYISAGAHLDRIRGLFLPERSTRLPGVDVVAISLAEAYYTDQDAMDAMGDLVTDLVRSKLTVFMIGFPPGVRRMFDMQHWSHGISVFPDYGSLLVHMREVTALAAEKGPGGGDLNEYVAARVAVAVEQQLAGATALAPPPGTARRPEPTSNRPSASYRLLGGGATPAPAAPSGGGGAEPAGAAAPRTPAPGAGAAAHALPQSRLASPAGTAADAFSPASAAGAGGPLTHAVDAGGVLSPAPPAGGAAPAAAAAKGVDDW